jgi:hypothetical protein
MYTAMAFVALTSGMTAGNISQSPNYLSDYATAQMRVVEAGKPMVVFIGTGKTGYESVVREGKFDAAVNQLLSSKFVCLYVDTTTTSGRSLANALQIKNLGVVISDRAGTSQAYSASGAISQSELQRALVRYADGKEIKGTETLVQGAGATPPVKVAPAPVAVAPGYGSGCGTGYGSGYGGGCCGFGGKGAGYGGGWGGGWGGGCCGKGAATPVVHAVPVTKAPVAPAPVKVAPAPVAHPVAAPAYGSGCGGKGFGGGCCGFGGGYGAGYGGGCGKGYGGGWGGGCCGWGGGYGGGCK